MLAAAEHPARPDVVVTVPDGARVVIDAKTPYESYSAALQTDDGEERARLLAEHAERLLAHARELQRRDYPSLVGTSLDFVLMYLPAEPLLDAAVSARPGVWTEAWEKHRVLIATPGLLIATPGLLIAFLRTVALAWRRSDEHRNAREIADAGRELHDRLKIHLGHLEKMGRGLNGAVKSFNEGVGSLERRVLPQARRLGDLGGRLDGDVAAGVPPADTAIRLVAGAGE